MSVSFKGWLFDDASFQEAIKKGVDSTKGQKIERFPKARSRVRTGRMLKSWQSRVEDDGIRVGSYKILYTVYNEYGTRKMAAQPMLAPSIEPMRTVLANEIVKAVQEIT